MDQEKRKHIICAAMEQFNTYGFHAMPTSKIAKAAGVSVGTLFNYFETKEDLIQAIYIEVKINSKKEFIKHFNENLSDYDLFKSIWGTYIHWGIDNPEQFKYMSLYTHSPFKKQHHEEELTSTIQNLKEAFIKIAIPNQACTQYPAFSMIYLNNAFQATTNFIINNDIEDKEHFINSSFDLFWNGFSG